MTFTTIPSGWLDVGDPTKKELFDYIKANEDDLNTRTTVIEAFGAGLDVFNFDLRNATNFTTLSNMFRKYISKPQTLNDCFIQIYAAGSLTGTVEIDILKSSTLNGTYTSVFTTKPSIDVGVVADYGKSTNQVFSVSQVALIAGDYLKLNITSMPTGGVLSQLKIILTSEAT
jgi:hypothetical protein